MNFELALTKLKQGLTVTRDGWNGKGMFLIMVPGSEFQVSRPPLNAAFKEGTSIRYHAHIDIMTAQGYLVPWVASQADLLAEDWIAVYVPERQRELG